VLVSPAGVPVKVLGIDPGPTVTGWTLYDGERVLEAGESPSWGPIGVGLSGVDLVAIEQVQSYGQSGASLLRTAEVGGAIAGRALMSSPVVWVPRQLALRALDVLGAKGSRDALVRQRLMELHGGSKEAAVGKKASPGPLYGLKGHGWAALAVAYTAGGARSGHR
jgi:hypothetical protein